MSRRTRNTLRGFTLIEMLTILLVIAAIVLLTIPAYRWAVQKAQLGVCHSNLRNIAQAVQIYSNDNDSQLPNDINQVTPDYIKIIPECAAAGQETYTQGYEHSVDNKNFTIACYGINHSQLGLGWKEPYWNLKQGIQP